jgi:uncharacterized protein involved in exopolysaccharide biosynthesis
METKRGFWRPRSVITDEVEGATQLSIEAKRRRIRMIVTLALSGALGGFLVSHVFPPKYTSQSTVLVEGQKVPAGYVQPIITTDFTERIQMLSQEVLGASRLRPVLHSLAIVTPDDEGKFIEKIQQNIEIEPVITSMSAAAHGEGSATKEASATAGPIPGFNVSYTDSNPVRAQKICNVLTSLIVDENLRFRAGVAQETLVFLNQELEEAKRTLDEQDARIADFKKAHMGQLPTDGRTAMNPTIEEQYKMLTRDNDTNEAFYKDLLAKRNAAKLGADMDNEQLGEQMHVAAGAGLPEAPSFPDRPLFALWGLGAGLLLGIGRALWPSTKAKGEPGVAAPSGDSVGAPER